MKRLAVLFIICFLPSSSFADVVPNNCLFSKYQSYAKAQEKWQHGSTALVKELKPQFAEVSELYMLDQLVLIEQRLIAVELLLANVPEKLETELKLNQWLDLSEEDHQMLAQHSKRYSLLLSKTKDAKIREPHPDGGALRIAMRNEIMMSSKFQVLLSSFNEEVKSIEKKVCDKVK